MRPLPLEHAGDPPHFMAARACLVGEVVELAAPQ
jgi:hypothetical protein